MLTKNLLSCPRAFAPSIAAPWSQRTPSSMRPCTCTSLGTKQQPVCLRQFCRYDFRDPFILRSAFICSNTLLSYVSGTLYKTPSTRSTPFFILRARLSMCPYIELKTSKIVIFPTICRGGSSSLCPCSPSLYHKLCF